VLKDYTHIYARQLTLLAISSRRSTNK